MGANIFWLAFRNLCRSRIRTILTLVGVGGSIALFVSLTCISSDIKQQLDQTVARSNIDIIVQQKGASTPVTSRVEMVSIHAIERIEGVKSVSSVIVGSVKTQRVPYLLVFGVSSQEPYFSLSKWLGTGLIDGRMLRYGKPEVLLGRLAAKRLRKKVGDSILLGAKQEYLVSGIYWLGQSILDGSVIVEINSSQDILRREGFVNLAMIEAHNKNQTAGLIRDIARAFPGLDATPASSLRKQIRAVTMIDGFIASVSILTLLLSGVLILNTLLMAISERTREIGVLMAIGWSRLMIIRLIVTEALLLGAFGGLIGYGGAFPALQFIKFLPTMGPGWIPAVPAPEQLLSAMGLACGIAGISSLYPALFATRLLPAAALRYE